MVTLVFHENARKYPNSMTLNFTVKYAEIWQSRDSFTLHRGILAKLTVSNNNMMLEFIWHTATLQLSCKCKIFNFINSDQVPLCNIQKLISRNCTNGFQRNWRTNCSNGWGRLTNYANSYRCTQEGKMRKIRHWPKVDENDTRRK